MLAAEWAEIQRPNVANNTSTSNSLQDYVFVTSSADQSDLNKVGMEDCIVATDLGNFDDELEDDVILMSGSRSEVAPNSIPKTEATVPEPKTGSTLKPVPEIETTPLLEPKTETTPKPEPETETTPKPEPLPAATPKAEPNHIPYNLHQLSAESGGRRTLKSFHGTFLRAYDRKWEVDMAEKEQAWEHWYVEDWKGKVVFKAIHSPGRFLRAYPDGSVDLVDRPQAWETWMPFKNDDGSWSFLSHHRKWLSARDDGSVKTVNNCDRWEHFWLGWW